MDTIPSTVLIERLRRAADHRGYVFEPLDAEGLAAHKNVHVVLTAPGEIRGNHFHETGTEVTAVSGPARVRIKNANTLETHDIPEGETWRFTFPPRVTHAFQNTGSTALVIVSFNTLPHDPGNPNTTREVVL
ncbi:MAG TPA: cupin domain-containing protein [Steroidobacteraceae bacterium]|nr:cupin domain-containing protein [Steroidobacteraceae bacterium]